MSNSTLLAALALIAAACGGSGKPATDPTPVATDPSMAGNPGAAADTTPASPEPVAMPPTPAEGTAEPAAPPVDPKVAAADAEKAAYARALPVLEKYCAKCHQPGQKKAKKKILDHFAFTAGGATGHHGHALGDEMREVLGIGGGKATMPLDAPGAVKGDELAAVAAWAEAHDAANPQ